MLILFATMTGNAEDAAETIAKRLKKLGHEPTVANIEKHAPESLLTRGQPVLFVVSTWGEGEPPDEALEFWETLEKLDGGALEGLRYAVYALGDSSYDEFCGFGRNLEMALGQKGGVCIAARAECDCDYEEFVESWTEQVHSALQGELAS